MTSLAASMGDHFSAVGIDLPDPDALTAFAMIADLDGVGGVGRRLTWRDPSGAAIVYFLDANHDVIHCAKPTFEPTRRVPSLRIGASALVPGSTDPCPYCAVLRVEVLDDDGELLYPLAVELDDMHLGIDLGDRLDLVGIVEHIDVWPDLAAHAAAAGAGPQPALAAECLIPSGLFTADDPSVGPRAVALVGGVVVGAHRVTNHASRSEFDWLRVRTYGQALDLVVGAGGPPFATGQVILASCWLVGRRPAP